MTDKTPLKVGDFVTYRKPADKDRMYLGVGGCKITKLKTEDQAVIVEWRGEEFAAPLSWLTLEPGHK